MGDPIRRGSAEALLALKVDFCPQSEDDNLMCPATSIDVILNHRLHEHGWRDMEHAVQFQCVFHLERWRAGTMESRTEVISYLSQQDGVVKLNWKGLVIAKSGIEFPVVPIHVGRAPIVGNRGVNPFRFPPCRLARWPGSPSSTSGSCQREARTEWDW